MKIHRFQENTFLRSVAIEIYLSTVYPVKKVKITNYINSSTKKGSCDNYWTYPKQMISFRCL